MATNDNVYNRIPYDGPTCPETGLPLVPKYGRTEDDGRGGEVYPVIDIVRVSDDLSMPSLAQQWRQDWQARTARARRRGVEINTPKLRAPQSFIDTGIWPKEDS